MNDGNCNTPERIALLEAIRGQGKTWDVLAAKWGVTNENPPWKTSLVAMCGCIGTSEALPALDIRQTEDQLADTVYKDTPAPERQLLALAHTLLARGLVDEKALAKRMQDVRARLEAA
jgi:hypothetical protein